MSEPSADFMIQYYKNLWLGEWELLCDQYSEHQSGKSNKSFLKWFGVFVKYVYEYTYISFAWIKPYICK